MKKHMITAALMAVCALAGCGAWLNAPADDLTEHQIVLTDCETAAYAAGDGKAHTAYCACAEDAGITPCPWVIADAGGQ